MSSTFDAALDQIEHLTALMGVPDSVRGAIRMLIVQTTNSGQIEQRVRVRGEAPTLAQIARRFHKSSLSRNDMLVPGIVQDGPWNMLLDLFAAGEEGRAISVSSLCLASGMPATTALRAIRMLIEHKMIDRVPDWNDRRRAWLQLTPKAREQMAAMISAFTVPTPMTLVLR